ncbi:MAG: M24 family metallopeptidase [Myxococcota bacterium]|nr:M24 family metallopeptidase [Myxococcota bacterium]
MVLIGNVPGSEIDTRIAQLRKEMKKHNLDALIVRSSDPYLNEYVPPEDSLRMWLTGFTGSMGDAVVTPKAAFVVVDGRYWVQAEKETKDSHVSVEKVPFGTSIADQVCALVNQLAKRAKKTSFAVGFDCQRNTPLEVERLKKSLSEKCTLKGLSDSLIEKIYPESERGASSTVALHVIPEKKFGKSVKEKLSLLKPLLKEQSLEGILVQKLDTIAYITNLRAFEMPFQATFRSIALVTKNVVYLYIHRAHWDKTTQKSRPGIQFVDAAGFKAKLDSLAKKKASIGITKSQNTVWAEQLLENSGIQIATVPDLIAPLKAKKNRAEMRAMSRAFSRADKVVQQSIHWLCESVVAGAKITEWDFAQHVEKEFMKSGAKGLSFRVISAAGKNGALIHYSPKNSTRIIKRGELMLLDTGAYFDEAYATDLTRTFLVDSPRAKASKEQRYYFTMVLKSAIAGMSAVLPTGFRGYQLDAITRAPLWQEGLDFKHGTGHGVGINVHEFPPRVGPNASHPVEEGHVFSIEPGVYMPKFGGIRIENLCTVEKLPGRKGYSRVKPMTFSPLDRRLIETSLLSKEERQFLKRFSDVYDERNRARMPH